MYQIGEMSRRLGVSMDTLRYHEKDISRVKFIRRSRKMGFNLDEIKQLPHS